VGNSKIHRIPKGNCVPILKVYLYWPIIDALYIYNPRPCPCTTHITRHNPDTALKSRGSLYVLDEYLNLLPHTIKPEASTVVRRSAFNQNRGPAGHAAAPDLSMRSTPIRDICPTNDAREGTVGSHVP
jgi:hypothetical protein